MYTVVVNVSTSALSEEYIKKLEEMSPKEFLDEIGKYNNGISSRDLVKMPDGKINPIHLKQKYHEYEYYSAIKANKLTMEVQQRRGYKAFIIHY